ncbi:hypothetical protein GCM10022259_00530 [Aquimarina mytili]
MILNTQKIRLSKNLLLVRPSFQSLNPLNAEKDPRQLENKTDADNKIHAVSFFIIINFKILINL